MRKAVLKDKSRCCGCGACAAICPHDAISMAPDAEGFLYPRINWYYDHIIGLNIPRFFRETLRGILPALLLAGAVGALTLLMPSEGWMSLGARVAVICAAYAPLMYFVGMNAGERAAVLRLARRLRR